MKRSQILIIIFILIMLVLGGGYLWQASSLGAMGRVQDQPKGTSVTQDDSGKTVLYWYDPMVPDQKFDKPGKSPFMDMQLVPKYASQDGEDSGVMISPTSQQNLGIRIAKVESKSFAGQLAAVGRIQPDERQYYAVQTRVPGFVERLYARAIGDPVIKGQKVAEVYAPELLGAQQEYLALLDLNYLPEEDQLKVAARNRLKLLGMTEGEIAEINRSGHASPRFGIYAPASGVITELAVREGGQIMAGTSLMQISDLSRVWLQVEIPERDAGGITVGMLAEAQLQGMPDVVTGKVNYIYPALDETTRTMQVRVELPNPGFKLRPGMYANVAFAGDKRNVLAIPSESVIATGKRKVVILKEAGGFRPVEVATGQQAGAFTEIVSGLAEGESVVTSGQFLIDSEASLSGVLARLAQQDPSGIEDMSMPVAKSGKAKAILGLGKVTDIDPKSGDITLAHDPIPELGWPSMTMGFVVQNVSQLKGLNKGDQVKFELMATDEEQYQISRIEKKGGKP